jgi:hypothetical protein
MASEGTSTVPRMGSFKRALLGYRRDEVDAAISDRDAAIEAVELHASAADAELASLSGMVIEREREIRALHERLREANERHDRSIASLHSISERLEEVQAQARGQATRIRMKALHEAVEVSRRTQELADVHGEVEGDVATGAQNGSAEAALGELFEGLIRMEIGPLGDFSQLVGFENAVGRLGASEISVERFSEGRATLSMHLDEPIELLRKLEENAPFEFNIRRTGADDLILDIDEDQGPEQRAA